MKKTKTTILIILAMVMVLSLAFALIPTETFAQVSPIAPVEPPKGELADGTTVPYFEASNVTGDNADFTLSGGTYTGCTATANSGSGWTVLKIIFRNTGTFSWQSDMTTYYKKSGWLGSSVAENSTGHYYYTLVDGTPATDLTYEQIKSGRDVNEAKGKKPHYIDVIQLTNDTATLYFAFQSNKIDATWGDANDILVLSDMSFIQDNDPANPIKTINFSVSANVGSISATLDGTAITNGAQVERGKTVSLTANPDSGNKFYYWTLDGEYYSDQQTIEVSINSNKTIVAEIRPAGYYKVKSYDGKKYWTSVKAFLDDETFAGKAMLLPYAEV
ncbi:MAG: hypothetical protein J6Q55_03845, partial [Clostridia bacterium]|nr:hypothetical protein [Clostridia bacterium]